MSKKKTKNKKKRISIKKTPTVGFTKMPDPELQQVIEDSKDVNEVIKPDTEVGFPVTSKPEGGAWC